MEDKDVVTLNANIQVQPGSVRRERPSKAQLRKKLKSPDKWERMKAWSYLQYRKEHGMR